VQQPLMSLFEQVLLEQTSAVHGSLSSHAELLVQQPLIGL
jgi:hypothetical protein